MCRFKAIPVKPGKPIFFNTANYKAAKEHIKHHLIGEFKAVKCVRFKG